MDMSDLPPPPPESTGQPKQSELPTAVQPIDEFGNPFEISDFKEASFLNGLFITLIVALILSEISFVVTTVLKIHALDLYYSGFSKVSIVDPNHQHARSELVTATTVSGIVAIGCLFFLLLSSICMLCWMFRNYKNSIALAQGRLKYSAGEATAGLAIPFVSLSRPYFVSPSAPVGDSITAAASTTISRGRERRRGRERNRRCATEYTES
jgi:hypothetical protein